MIQRVFLGLAALVLTLGRVYRSDLARLYTIATMFREDPLPSSPIAAELARQEVGE